MEVINRKAIPGVTWHPLLTRTDDLYAHGGLNTLDQTVELQNELQVTRLLQMRAGRAILHYVQALPNDAAIPPGPLPPWRPKHST